MKCFIYNFLCVPSLTIEFGVAFLTVVFTILSLVIFGVNASVLSSMISKQPIVLVIILLLLLTWCIAVVGASMRSRTIITFTIVLWTIFIIMWLVLSLFFRVIKHNTQYCVADKTRCATSMWLIGKGNGDDKSDGDDETPSDEEEGDGDDGDEEERYRRRLRLKNYSPELTVKNFHPTRANAMLTPATLAANTVVSNHMSVMIGVNNGFGCERHQRTTTESPPSDLITRLAEYRKHMTMYRKPAVAAIQKRKKIERKKVLEDYEEEEDGDDEEGDDEASEDTDDEGASSSPVDLLLMSVFLRKIPLFFSVTISSLHAADCSNDVNNVVRCVQMGDRQIVG